MRDPKRIKPFLKKIEELWLKNPDFRFGQLIIGIAKSSEIIPQLFYMEEKEFLEKIGEMEKQLRNK